ncbi:hypothetical protein KGM_210746A, partial [Danaus plexippus plexippus]
MAMNHSLSSKKR